MPSPFYVVTHPSYSFDFPSDHRFPMEKFARLHQLVQDKGIATMGNTIRPGKAKLELLQHTHCSHYLDRLISNRLSSAEQRQLGLPWSEGLIKRTLISPNGTFLTASLALQHGIACHLAGGTHHAHYDYGTGFCALNDLAIAANGIINRAKRKGQRSPQILIFDCDVHQGDGTATLLAEQDKAFTCSIHCEQNFPKNKARSDLDVNIAAGCKDDEYINTVKSTFVTLINAVKPDLILYDAGVDVYEHDPLGLLNISVDGIRYRDEWVLSQCKQRGIPVATVIGGGYDKDRDALVKRHAIIVEAAHRVYCRTK